MGQARGRRKSFVGWIVSDRMDRTRVVMVERLEKHPLYGKYVRRRVKFMAHDENNDCKKGDKVVIVETRPISRHKRWRIKEILERAR